MEYHGAVYLLLFLPFTLMAYQLTPQKKRWITLLLAGYVFFWSISGKLVLYLVGTSLFTHYIGIWLARTKEQYAKIKKELPKEQIAEVKKKYKNLEKKILAFGIVGLLCVLLSLKYSYFFLQNINTAAGLIGYGNILQPKKILIPIGISFYTLQAISYMVDVYWERIQAEMHPGKGALFLSFFPQIMEGPISLYSQTADALWKGETIKTENLSKGSVRILWGLFKKIIIADRIYILVEELFGHYKDYSGVMILVAAAAYTIQLYMEFSGCMDIILGSGRMFGIVLPENFQQPFSAESASDFWRRWHITLGVWFKTYVFYPVSSSKPAKRWTKYGKKHLNKYVTTLGLSAIALFPVWLCNGLWHGPRWSYIFYGMYYFVILLGETAMEPVRKAAIQKWHIPEKSRIYHFLRVAKTWGIIIIGELFFRAESFMKGLYMFKNIFRNFEISRLWDGTLLTLGLDKADYLVLAAGCMVVAIVGSMKERNLLGDEGVQRFCLPVRWAIYYGLFFSVIIFGAYGTGYQQVEMIYAGF